MYKAEVYKKGNLIHSVTYDCQTAEEAKVSVINSMYWNVITCSESNEPKWWEKYEYKITDVKKEAYEQMRKDTGTNNKFTLIEMLNKKYPNTNFNSQIL